MTVHDFPDSLAFLSINQKNINNKNTAMSLSAQSEGIVSGRKCPRRNDEFCIGLKCAAFIRSKVTFYEKFKPYFDEHYVVTAAYCAYYNNPGIPWID